MHDLISRQAAIDALKEHRALYCDNTPASFSELSFANKSRVDELDTAIATLINLPSAQLTQNNRVNSNNALDTISRQEAIDAVCMEWCNVKHQNCEHPFDIEKDDYYWCDGCETALQTLPNLPSAQPEGIKYVELSEEDYEKIAEQLRKIPIVLTLSEPEIVRCAECKWFQYNMRFDGHLPKGVDEFECRHWCGSCDPTDFCSYAERKWEEDEDE